MKEKTRHILRFSLFAAFIAAFIALTAVLLHYSNRRGHEIDCNKVEVFLPGDKRFVSEQDIHSIIENQYGLCIGCRLDELDLARIESILRAQSVVRGAEAWATGDGVLHITVQQREPVVRFIKGDSGFYVDRKGWIFPLSGQLDSTVVTVDGAVLKAADTDYILGFLDIKKALERDRFWSAHLDHYTILENGDVAINDDRGLVILLGSGERLGAKLELIREYYSTIEPSRPECYYKSINVKYKNQIICRTDTQLQ